VILFAPVRILYFYRVPIPSPRADAIQIVHTCAAMSRAGGRVTLHVEEIGSPSVAELLEYYGVEPFDSGAVGSLDLAAMGRHWSWPFLTLRTAKVLRSVAGSEACLLLREVRPYVPGLMGRARAAGLKTIFEAHNVSTSLVEEKEIRSSGAGSRGRAEDRAALERSILEGADGLICTQRRTLERLRPLLQAGTPAIVLGNGTPAPRAASHGPEDIDVLYCGSLKEWKGVDTLVEAMQTLHPHLLTIVGPGTREDLSRLRHLALALGMAGRVKILPPVKPAEVWPLYARAKVGVIPLPSGASVEAREFTSPLKLFEMMAAGLPMVASNLPSLSEYVQNEKEALLVLPDDPRALAAGIRRLLTDDPLRLRLSAAGRQRAATFTWDERGRRILEFARNLFSLASG
jgi:glycosyltransferase involved in cell wall biosynthesis